MEIRLRHKLYESLTFGPESEIQFGIKGGFPPGEIVIDTEHPLYNELWEREGASLEEVTAGPAKVYVSPIDPSLEFPSRAALLASIRREAQVGDPLAVAWLDRNGDDIDDEPLEEPQPLVPAFSAPQPDVEPAAPAGVSTPARRRATRRGKGRSTTRQSKVVASPAPLPPAGVLPPGGV